MKVAIYARVSTERQAERGTIGSQLQLLREHVSAGGDELAGEYVDDGHSGARLDRPGLDALRDAAEAGLFEVVWCLSPDRLARAYAYQVLVLDELTRFGVKVRFSDAPDLAAGDPQATLLTQVQGVIAEYEKAKIAERYRRGKLFRARAGEIISWKTSYGYRRVARTGTARRTWRSTNPKPRLSAGSSLNGPLGRRSARLPAAQRRPCPHRPVGRPGALHAVPAAGQRGFRRPGLLQPHRDRHRAGPARRTRQVPRPREEWISIGCPPIITDEQFQAARVAATTPMEPAPRRTRRVAAQGPGQVRRLRRRHQLPQDARAQRHLAPLLLLPQPRPAARRRRGAPLPRTQHPRRRPRRVRLRPRARRLTEPALLLAGEQAVTLAPADPGRRAPRRRTRPPRPQDRRHHRRRRRLVDFYQAGLIEMPELQRRSGEVAARQRDLQGKRSALGAERTALAHGNLLRHRVNDFAQQIRGVIDQLDRPQQQHLLRLLSRTCTSPAHTSRSSWHPLDPPDPGPASRPDPRATTGTIRPVQPRPFAFPRWR